MAEREVVLKEKVGYEGLFSVKELVRLAKDWASRKGYDAIEKKHYESVLAEGKKIDLELELSKRLTDYAKAVINLRYAFSDVTERVVERADKKETLNHGKVDLEFEGVLETDWEKRWEVKPTFYVLRKLFESYVYSPVINEFKKTIKEDLRYVKENSRAFLNLYKM